MKEKEVIALIDAAFASVPRPAKELLTECTCAECLEIRDDLSDRNPEDLDPAIMRYHSWDMGFLTPEARHYYIAGWMKLGILRADAPYSDAVVEILSAGDIWLDPGQYSLEQKKAMWSFLEFIKRRNGECSYPELDALLEAGFLSEEEKFHGGYGKEVDE
ncbi:MAG: hypothetical protein QM627_11130 [Luteolibacter sp.]